MREILIYHGYINRAFTVLKNSKGSLIECPHFIQAHVSK